MEFTGHPAAASQPAQLLQVVAIQNIDCHVGVITNIEATLRFVWGEIHGNCGSNYIGVFTNELLRQKAAFASFARRIAARLAQRGAILIKNLNPIVSSVADIDLAIIGDLYAMYGVPEE